METITKMENKMEEHLNGPRPILLYLVLSLLIPLLLTFYRHISEAFTLHQSVMSSSYNALMLDFGSRQLFTVVYESWFCKTL